MEILFSLFLIIAVWQQDKPKSIEDLLREYGPDLEADLKKVQVVIEQLENRTNG
ncbi:hypothetical protein [Cecembia sp.]|uniref:hypothetical protein n=1 Tax=Cecembia sp. TaxID=1898110 RepID=UPI0025C10FC0|nr:hypothetical protein [Cecembia sp.]